MAPPPSPPVRTLVIAGGGSAGWMAAAAAARFLADGERRILLIESDEIGTIGVGEATIPPFRDFNARIGIDEAELFRETGATAKLGIAFDGWGRADSRYLHPFGQLGHDFEGVDFHQYWYADRTHPLDDYWMASWLIRAARFAPPSPSPRTPLSGVAFAYHLDAARYAAHLRRVAEAGGVTRIEGRIEGVERDGETGNVTALRLADGRRVEGDFFLDCSGFRSLLLGDAMAVPFDDWSRWLPCDRAIAVPSDPVRPLPPVTRSIAHGAGWRWQIPLQHRHGNGIVYASALLDDDAAETRLRDALGDNIAGEPRRIRFKTGVRGQLWTHNVIALGLAGGFIEPLESTALHLIQTGIAQLLWLFPDRGDAPRARDEYNRAMRAQYEYIRDFIILHYHLNERPEPLWRAAAAMALPDSLADTLALFREGGQIRRHEQDLFALPSWVAVLAGQGEVPRRRHPMLASMDMARIGATMGRMRAAFAEAAQTAPDHGEALARLFGVGAVAMRQPA